ncbi:MAG: hypothetical protein JEZ14_25985, partial [Marinilabiliaceae bacterium]|nr:hypothetical protein [Marinilabiliaceae bacterium]
MKIVRPNKLAKNYAGAFIGKSSGADLGNFELTTRYVHMKVYKQRITPVNLKLLTVEGSNPDQASLQKQTLVSQWEDLVFDFEALTGQKMKRMILRPDYEVGEQHVMYVDDIVFSNDPEPAPGVSTLVQKNRMSTLKVVPNPVKETLTLSGL